jgi:hypothetical protein
MTAAVFDAAAIRARRQELFPPPDRTLAEAEVDRERFGTRDRHCGVCPRHVDEPCPLSCSAQRGALNDGVTVT